jgi:hypothetical protein
MRIAEALDIPQTTSLDEFITSLDDSESRVRKNLETFVLAPDVEKKVDDLLRDAGGRIAQGRDIGRFVYGTFGSGKSHLLTVLGKMLEREEAVYALGDPALRTLRANHPWIDANRTLVVRLNMMGKSSLVSALYNAFNAALPEGAERLVFTDEKRVFELIERDAERHAGGLDKLIERMVADQVFRNADFYHRNRHGTLEQQLDLAARLLTWRDHGGKQVRPSDLWVPAEDGFARIAQHAKSLGYTAITWLIDELVIWLRGQSRDVYVEQINHLSALVDHDAKSSRPVPFLVLVAVQQDIKDTCPEDLSEKQFRDQLGFVSDRFKPNLVLEDQDLYEVAARRVLRPRPENKVAFQAAVERMFKEHGDTIRALSGELEPDLVRRLYPFHPALLRVLVDVTQALSRNRTAIAALYGLLGRHASLEVGSFVPVGSLFDILFTSENVETVRTRASSPLAGRFVDSYDTYERLRGKIDEAARSVSGADEKELHQLVRTVLLCQLSDRPYFPSGQSLHERVTAKLLLRLNQSDVRAFTERGGVSKVGNLFRALSDPHVEVVGDTSDPRIAVRVDRVDVERVLAAARADLKHEDRFSYIRKLLDSELGLKLGAETGATLHLTWRGTRRKGQVRLANVRTLSYAGQDNEFDPGNLEVLILVDYPFDQDPACTRQDDIAAVQKARQRKRQWTLAWLPEHFRESERRALDNGAAIERIRAQRRHYVESQYSARDAEQVARALEAFQQGQEEVLRAAIKRLYFEEGTVEGVSELLDGIRLTGRDPGKAIEGLAHAVLDARYPNHPMFGRRVQMSELEKLAGWVVEAAQTGQPKDLRAADRDIVDAYGVPLEIVYASESSITRRTDGRFLSAVHAWVKAEPDRFRASSLREKLMAGGKEGFGFTDETARFFLHYLLHVEGYEAVVNGEARSFDGLAGQPPDFELRKADVVDAPTWDRARSAARMLLAVETKADLPSPPEQTKLSRDITAGAEKLKKQVDELLGVLKKVLVWAEVPVSESQRALTIGKLSELLGQLGTIKDHAGRVRLAASLGADKSLLDLYQLVRVHGAEERRALDAMDARRQHFEQVRKYGDPTEQSAVVTALQNLLRDPVSRRVANVVTDWVAGADHVFDAVLKRLDKAQKPSPTPVPKPPADAPPPPIGRKSNRPPAIEPTGAVGRALRTGVPRAEAEAALRAMLKEALRGIDAGQVDIEIVVKPHKPAGGVE